MRNSIPAAVTANENVYVSDRYPRIGPTIVNPSLMSKSLTDNTVARISVSQ